MSKKLQFYKQCLTELYPFNETDLGFFKDKLNFRYVSANRKIDWQYELIKEFEGYWDWSILNCNKTVFEKVTLGLLFPDKVDLPICDCYRMEDFCEDSMCYVNLRRFETCSNLYNQDSNTYGRIAILCGTGLVTRSLLIEVLVKNETFALENLLKTYFF
jgi:hypothetical protein